MKSLRMLFITLFCLCAPIVVFAAIPEIVLAQKKAVVTIYIEDKGKVIAYGSGFIIDGSGIVVTNHHVIAPWEKSETGLLYVKQSSNDFLEPLEIIATDEEKDVALIKVKGTNLPFIKMAKSYKAAQGEDVVVIGTPLGFETTVTTGIVSGIRGTDGFLQISAPVSPGSSGSPVLNSKGEAIGVATLVMKGGQNLNFAIPVNYVSEISSQERSNQPKGLSKATNADASTQQNTQEVLSSEVPDTGLKPVEIPAGAGHKGKVLQTMDAGSYTYVEVEEKDQQLWIAVMKEALVKEGVKVGDYIEFPDSPPMFNFQSKELKKTFDKVMFSAGLRKVENSIDEYSIEGLNSLIELDPMNANLYLKRANIYLSERKYAIGTPDEINEIKTNNKSLCSESLKDLTHAITLNDKLTEAFVIRADLKSDDSFCNYNEISQAISDYDRAITLQPNNPDYWVSKGHLHAKLNEMNMLLECAKKAIKLNSKDDGGYYLFGMYYNYKGNYTKALEYIKKGLSVNSKSVVAWNYVDEVMEKSKQYHDAIKLYSDLINQNPKVATLYIQRGKYYNKVNNYKKAIADYTSAINLKNVVYYYAWRAEAYYNNGDMKSALNDYNKSCEMGFEYTCEIIPKVQADIRRGEKWVFIDSSDATSWYYDKSNLERTGNIINLWSRVEITDKDKYLTESNGYPDYLKDKFKNISHIMNNFEIDCSGKRMRAKSNHIYSDSGAILESDNFEKSKFESIIPESIGYSAYKKVCGQSLPKKETKNKKGKR